MKQNVVINTFCINIVWYRLFALGCMACFFVLISALYNVLTTGMLFLVIILFAVIFSLVFTGNRFRKLFSKRAEIIIGADEVLINLYNINSNFLEGNYNYPLAGLSAFRTSYISREGIPSVVLYLSNGTKKTFSFWESENNVQNINGAVTNCIAAYNTTHPKNRVTLAPAFAGSKAGLAVYIALLIAVTGYTVYAITHYGQQTPVRLAALWTACIILYSIRFKSLQVCKKFNGKASTTV